MAGKITVKKHTRRLAKGGSTTVVQHQRKRRTPFITTRKARPTKSHVTKATKNKKPAPSSQPSPSNKPAPTTPAPTPSKPRDIGKITKGTGLNNSFTRFKKFGTRRYFQQGGAYKQLNLGKLSYAGKPAVKPAPAANLQPATHTKKQKGLIDYVKQLYRISDTAHYNSYAKKKRAGASGHGGKHGKHSATAALVHALTHSGGHIAKKLFSE